MRHLLLFEKFTELEVKPLSKKELKRLKYSKELTGKTLSVEDLKDYGVPSEIQEMMKTWDVIYKSPYSNSFYSSTDVNWGQKPDKSYRASDHWNFYTREKWHCQTDEKVPNNTHISIGQYDKESGKYHIILSLPTTKQQERQSKQEIKLKHLKDPETIYRKKLFKDRILNKEVLVKLNYGGKDYEGVVRKYTGGELKIENEEGEQIFGENYMETSKTGHLGFFDRSGNKIENPIEWR